MHKHLSFSPKSNGDELSIDNLDVAPSGNDDSIAYYITPDLKNICIVTTVRERTMNNLYPLVELALFSCLLFCS